MRKRRRLANKMTMMVCAVLIAVSAFFYAPMEVRASSIDLNGSTTTGYVYPATGARFSFNTNSYDFGVVNSDFVEVDFDIDFSFIQSLPYAIFSPSVVLHCGDFAYSLESSETWNSASAITSYNQNYNVNFVCKSSDLRNVYVSMAGACFVLGERNQANSISISANFNSYNFSPVTSTDGESYQNGYNAGYADGEFVGYGNGYSNGYADGEASVDTGTIYDEAFQAGKDSVDTQSYYDAGYEAGYQAAYSEGYESGYGEGYQSAMDRIDGWGADTSDYPKQIYSYYTGHTFSTNVTYSVPFLYRDSVKGGLGDVNLNPNHTYRFDVQISPSSWDSTGTISYEDEFYFCVGGIDYPLRYYFSSSSLTSLFVPGDRMSDSYYLVWSTSRASVDGVNKIISVVCPYTITLYDMGPSGDTQNHIANQTDQLTNGYNDSKGNEVNSELSTGLNEYETAENSLFATAISGMKDFVFFDFESVPAMVTGMSFVGSIMGSWFEQAGGASGVGIVLSILFSVMLVAMVLGLYRWYQSRGGKK